MLLGLVVLGGTSALLERFRFDHAVRRYVFGLPQLQVLHAGIAAVALLALAALRIRRGRRLPTRGPRRGHPLDVPRPDLAAAGATRVRD